ncbi:hypothetical protein M441DRAFT_373609 [Trichoderma asperellum CBS 433.97]|uniref:Macro domain-containing protein n=2 Tax=Trichoderma asperellum TaxID=101201 RepID=A0A2T3ZFB2_TRIA4|nr:hypothetical protein M441DRAFT_373609 [Trichoderma asperellum CBS 433.97]PTB43495.1 hypothetical protein M441DRAFT_373609 [Trichoderma asperellum CBS 433.97]
MASFYSSSRPSLKSAQDIPNIQTLYSTNRLSPPQLPFPYNPPREITPNEKLNARVCLIRADLTTLPVDAIVNAAKSSLRGGGGVDGAIHAAAGPKLVRECIDKYPGGCQTGQAVITGGHNLPAKHVIHTVGPVFHSERVSRPLLQSCYLQSLKVAEENGCSSIAFSAVSTGIYGYPSTLACEAACDAVRQYLEQDTTNQIQQVVFVTFMDKDVNAYRSILPYYFPPETAMG